MSHDDPMPVIDEETGEPVTWNEMELYYRQTQNPHSVPPNDILERWKAGQAQTVEEEEEMPF